MPLLKCSAGKAKPQAAIGYITNPNKAEVISVRNLFEDEDYAKQFEQTAALYGKGKGFNERKYYHFKLSCARQDNLSPQEAHKFAQEVAEKLFQDYECVLATHTDTDAVHSHIIVNAVNPLTGKKLQFSPKDYVAMKDEVNRLGKEHGYTETDFRKRGKNSRNAAERKIILNGGVSWKEELREVIVEAIGKSKDEQEFKDYLKTCYGVEITRSGKDFSYLHPQKQKPIRGAKLGTNYTKSEVLRKLGKQNNGQKPTANNGHGGGCIREQSSGARVVRTSRLTHGGGTGSLIAASLDCIEREMQQLTFAAECANRGTDAASEQRKIERERDRMESERRQRENAERLATEQQQSVGESESDDSANNGSSDADTSRSKYSYGKDD
ncbi:MAG: relaxase/mobilization nuclease domain-containing protein [Clostridia bacterium]|nr:relaxase/mobilization nuclease domain-containing protein [Clostridia bacterium]